tara:strand:+ start:4035 stop:5621 length:1587 start_codon:yes stop_codon:yes gene_type:complete
MATTTASDLSAFGNSKVNPISIGIDMDEDDVDTLAKVVKETSKRKTISSGGSSSSTPLSHASKKRRTQKKKKKKKKGNNSHSSSKMQVDAPEVLAVPAPNFPLFGFVDVAYLVFTVIWTACDLGSLMVEKSPDYESLRVRAFEELRGDEANDIEFPQHLARHKTELIALVKENNWTTTTDVTLYKRKCEVDDMKGGLEGVQHQTLLFALLVYMDWRVNGLAESKPALFDESKTIKECVKGLDFDYSSVGSAKNYLIETLYVATTGQDLPSHFPMDKLDHGLEIGKEHALKKKKMWDILRNDSNSFLHKMVSALREEKGDKRTAADVFWKGLSDDQQKALQVAATCVSAPDEATCKNFVMPEANRRKKAVPAECSPFTFEMNDDKEFKLVVPEESDGKKNPHYVYLERPVEANARDQIEQVMFGDDADVVIKALYALLCLVKRDKKGKGNPLRWKASFIDAMHAFVHLLNPVQEENEEDDDMNQEESNEEDGSSESSTSEIDSDAGSESDSDDESVVSDDENDVDGKRP